ncbi:unnamed protein product [Ascophyllum nodosum]
MMMKSRRRAAWNNHHLVFGIKGVIPQFPLHKVKRSAAISPKNPAEEIPLVDTKSRRSRPVFYTYKKEAVSGYGKGAASIKLGEYTSLIDAKREGLLSFDYPCWAPFKRVGISATHVGESQQESEDKPQVQVLSSFFQLECTNFLAKPTVVGVLSLSMLRNTLVKTLEQINVDIVEFVACHCVYECSYHQGNRFISFSVRVFEPPTKSSGQLLDADLSVAQDIEGGFLVELQLQQGDRFYFSGLFHELLLNFTKSQKNIYLTGTFRYKPRPYPEKGEGLVLERIARLQNTSRLTTRQPDKCVRDTVVSLPSEPMDDGMMENALKLVEALNTDFLDVQADAATAIAGLTSDVEFRNQLSDPKTKKAANALCRASARLLSETEYRPARRQAAVAVANLASTPALCRSLLKSDPSWTSPKQGIVDALVTLAILRSKQEEEEEIGTRRECMRALIGLAESKSARNMLAMRSLISATPSGKGAECKELLERLRVCKEVLTRPATLA